MIWGRSMWGKVNLFVHPLRADSGFPGGGGLPLNLYIVADARALGAYVYISRCGMQNFPRAIWASDCD